MCLRVGSEWPSSLRCVDYKLTLTALSLQKTNASHVSFFLYICAKVCPLAPAAAPCKYIEITSQEPIPEPRLQLQRPMQAGQNKCLHGILTVSGCQASRPAPPFLPRTRLIHAAPHQSRCAGLHKWHLRNLFPSSSSTPRALFCPRHGLPRSRPWSCKLEGPTQ